MPNTLEIHEYISSLWRENQSPAVGLIPHEADALWQSWVAFLDEHATNLGDHIAERRRYFHVWPIERWCECLLSYLPSSWGKEDSPAFFFEVVATLFVTRSTEGSISCFATQKGVQAVLLSPILSPTVSAFSPAAHAKLARMVAAVFDGSNPFEFLRDVPWHRLRDGQLKDELAACARGLFELEALESGVRAHGIDWFTKEYAKYRTIKFGPHTLPEGLWPLVEERYRQLWTRQRDENITVAKRKREQRASAEIAAIEKSLESLRTFAGEYPNLNAKRDWQTIDLQRVQRVYHILTRGRFSIPAKLRRAPHLHGMMTELRDFAIRFTPVIEEVLKLERTFRENQLEDERRRREAEHAAREKRRSVHERWQGRIQRRTSQIVHVFNGVYGRDISPSAVLTGEVEGSYATISSGSPSMGMGMSLRMDLRMEMRLHVIQKQTWLSLEEGQDEGEWSATYASANFLVWHELGHLAKPEAIERFVGPRHAFVGMPDTAYAQAKEVVIDAIGMNLATALYVHPDGDRAFEPTTDARRQVMLQAHLALVKRVLAACAGADLDDVGAFIVRLYAELSVHRELFRFRPAARVMRQIEQACISMLAERSALRELYAKSYARTLDELDVALVPFRKSLIDAEEGREMFQPSPVDVIH